MAYKPEFPYLGEQIIINSGRVTLNSKDDSIFLFGKKAIGFSSAGTINFDADDKVIINSPQIYLGIDAKEPLVKGQALENLLTDLLDTLDELGGKFMFAVDSNGVTLTTVMTSGVSLKRSVKRLKSNLSSIKSNKNFTI
jgi:hypothetical protein